MLKNRRRSSSPSKSGLNMLDVDRGRGAGGLLCLASAATAELDEAGAALLSAIAADMETGAKGTAEAAAASSVARADAATERSLRWGECAAAVASAPTTKADEWCASLCEISHGPSQGAKSTRQQGDAVPNARTNQNFKARQRSHTKKVNKSRNAPTSQKRDQINMQNRSESRAEQSNTNLNTLGAHFRRLDFGSNDIIFSHADVLRNLILPARE